MITRIKIDGFKSLLNTELYFGPFTCIAGRNAIGKSNFFDALAFLSKLTDNTVIHAAKSIRSENQRHSNVKDIFYRSGEQYFKKMSFEVDMLVPKYAEDDLGQKAEASITSLRYVLELKINNEQSDKELIEIVKEELKPITLQETRKRLYFGKKKRWVDSVVHGKKTTPFISTVDGKIKLHSDSKDKRGGRTTEFIAEKMPRTLLSTVTSESPTAFLARQEMRNWILFQFEPSALRQPNNTYEIKNAIVTESGNNLPATLYRLHIERKGEDVFQKLTNRVKQLVPDVDEISVDKDEKRDLLTLQIRFKDGLCLPAQSLSDGTLRFLGLSILREDNNGNTVICLEEPENGINPKKVRDMVELLEEISTDTNFEVDADNPLRQVIINSHSPLVVSTVADESLYMASEKEVFSKEFGKKIHYTSFSALSGTWKTQNKLISPTRIGDLKDYLDDTLVISTPEYYVFNDVEYSYLSDETKKRSVEENVKQYKLKLNDR